MNNYPLKQFALEVGSPDNLAQVLAVYHRLTHDPLLHRWFSNIDNSLQQGRRYWELGCALHQIGTGLNPANYLEIGIRRGKSMSMVAATCPNAAIYGFDLWITPYAGDENPGPDFVEGEMKRVGHTGSLTFFNGDSKDTVPAFIRQNPGFRFDLINVDGDHSDEGAWRDLVTTAELVTPGGYIVFDDISHPAHTLLPVLRRFQEEYKDRFEFVDNLTDHHGTSVGRRFDS